MQQHPDRWASQNVPASDLRLAAENHAAPVILALEQARTSLFLATSLLAFGGLVLAIRNRVHGMFLFASLLIFYPLVYYVSFPHPRYRHPIDPMLLMLAVYLFTQVSSRRPEPKHANQPLHAD